MMDSEGFSFLPDETIDIPSIKQCTLLSQLFAVMIGLPDGPRSKEAAFLHRHLPAFTLHSRCIPHSTPRHVENHCLSVEPSIYSFSYLSTNKSIIMARNLRAPTAPYSEPLLPQLDVQNPYYTDLHHNLRAWVRDYVDTSIAPYAAEWEAAGQVPESVRRRHCELGFSIVHPLTTEENAAGLSLPGNVPRDKWDTWCSLIVSDELTRVGYVGVIWGLGGGNGIGCPPVAKFGTPEQQNRWLPGVAKGDIRFCLGITEPDGTSSSSLNPFSVCADFCT